MDHETPPLLDRLRAAAEAWSVATGRTIGALSALVTNQGSFFDRLGSTRAGVSTTTLEKFASFLGEAGNWPGGEIAADASEFVHVVLGSAGAEPASPDTGAADIGSAGNSSVSEAAADPLAVPGGKAQPDDINGVAGASGRAPGAGEGGDAPVQTSTPGDLFAADSAGVTA